MVWVGHSLFRDKNEPQNIFLHFSSGVIRLLNLGVGNGAAFVFWFGVLGGRWG